MKDKHAEYFSKPNSFKTELKKKKVVVTEIETDKIHGGLHNT